MKIHWNTSRGCVLPKQGVSVELLMAGDGFLSLQGHLRKFRYVEKVSRSYGCFWLVASSQGHLRKLTHVGMVSYRRVATLPCILEGPSKRIGIWWDTVFLLWILLVVASQSLNAMLLAGDFSVPVSCLSRRVNSWQIHSLPPNSYSIIIIIEHCKLYRPQNDNSLVF